MNLELKCFAVFHCGFCNAHDQAPFRAGPARVQKSRCFQTPAALHHRDLLSILRETKNYFRTISSGKIFFNPAPGAKWGPANKKANPENYRIRLGFMMKVRREVRPRKKRTGYRAELFAKTFLTSIYSAAGGKLFQKKLNGGPL